MVLLALIVLNFEGLLNYEFKSQKDKTQNVKPTQINDFIIKI